MIYQHSKQITEWHWNGKNRIFILGMVCYRRTIAHRNISWRCPKLCTRCVTFFSRRCIYFCLFVCLKMLFSPVLGICSAFTMLFLNRFRFLRSFMITYNVTNQIHIHVLYISHIISFYIYDQQRNCRLFSCFVKCQLNLVKEVVICSNQNVKIPQDCKIKRFQQIITSLVL